MLGSIVNALEKITEKLQLSQLESGRINIAKAIKRVNDARQLLIQADLDKFNESIAKFMDTNGTGMLIHPSSEEEDDSNAEWQ